MVIIVVMIVAMGVLCREMERSVWGWERGRQKKKWSGKGNAFYYCACYFSGGSREHWNSLGVGPKSVGVFGCGAAEGWVE